MNLLSPLFTRLLALYRLRRIRAWRKLLRSGFGTGVIKDNPWDDPRDVTAIHRDILSQSQRSRSN